MIKEIVSWKGSVRVLVASRRETEIERGLEALDIDKKSINLQNDYLKTGIWTCIQSTPKTDPKFARLKDKAEVVEKKVCEKSNCM